MFHKATKQLFPYQLFLLFFLFAFLFHLETLSIFLGTKKADCLLAIDFDFFLFICWPTFWPFFLSFCLAFPFQLSPAWLLPVLAVLVSTRYAPSFVPVRCPPVQHRRLHGLKASLSHFKLV